jgi:ribosomal protein S20
MTVSSVSSAQNTYQTDVQSAWKQRAQDFKALQSALQSGDISSAQQAFAALQKDQQSSSQATSATSATSATGQNSQLANDFQALQSALSSGDLSSAQQAFSALKQDMQGAGRTGHHHHHHAGSVDSSTQTAATTQPLDTLLDVQA